MAKAKKRSARRGIGSTKTAGTRRAKKESKARRITGTVLKIVNGRPTNTMLAAEAAFSDLAQAREQVLYAERHGSPEEKRLVRLAFRQHQNMRFRAK